MPYVDQSQASCRVEWGGSGLYSLAPAEVVIVVDVLSFSTCVDVAVARGAVILPYRWRGTMASEYAASQRAELAGARGHSRYSLSPLSFREARGDLRCVLPSPNGGALALAAGATPSVVLTACLRNAPAVAGAAASLGTSINVLAAGERWSDGSVRFALEDWLGAGAVLAGLPGSKSPEALAAVAAFEQARGTLHEQLRGSSSGRELSDLGFDTDLQCAAQFDVSRAVPRLIAGAFTNISRE
jgi:2-phosphosulfolactate phosphatase